MGSQVPVSPGALNPWSTWGFFNNVSFAIQQALAKMQTATLVRVEACSNSGDVSPFGTVDVTPLVNQVDGAIPPNPTPHVTLYGIPYLRIQGGANGIIMDPEPGDIGIAVFASRDISKVKATQDQANPGSGRQYDLADGMYLGGCLNDAPTQYVQFNDDGITIVSPSTITLQADNIILKGAVAQSDGDVSINGALAQSGGDVTMAQKLTVTEDVIGAGISLQNHTHTSAPSGSPTSPPLP